MAYWDQKLEEAKQKVQRRRRLAAQLEELKRQEAELAARAAALDKSRIKEESDVDRLEGGTLSAFLLRMRKDREERLGKEREFDVLTVSGWVMEVAEKIPAAGEQFRFEDLEITVLEMDDKRVEKVRIVRTGEELPKEKESVML
mgnify:CR=1 FL=1